MWRGQEEANFRRVLDRYEELHPGVKIDNLGAVTDDTKTIRAIVAGVPPDIFTLSDPLYLGPMAANGALLRLDDLFKPSGLREQDFIPASLSQCRYRGGLYAMPYLIDCYALFWNKRHFREAGLNPERPPQTLEEFTRYAEKLTLRKGRDITRLGLQPLSDIYLMARLFGGRLTDDARTRVTPDDPANVAALQWYVDLVERLGGYQEVMGFQAGFGANQGVNNPFFVGQVSMMINGEWNPYWVHKFAPGLDYGVAPMPTPAAHPERTRSTWLGGNMFCIAKGAKHAKEAWDFLVWTQTEEAQILYASMMNNVPNIRSALGSRQLREGADYRRKFSVFLDLADSPNGAHFPALPVANLYSSEIATAVDLALGGTKQPAQALADVRRRVQRELDRYR